MKTLLTLSLAALAHQVAATEQLSDSLATTTTASKITVSNTNAGASTGTPRPTTWTAMGCYSQDPAQPILEERTTGNDIFMSIGLCTSRCSLGNFPFAGLQNGNQCWCGSHLGGGLAKNQSDCNVPCPGFAVDTCGGVEALNVFKAEGIDWAVSSTITTAPPASTLSKTGSVLTTVRTAGAMRNLALFGW
jgi:hypothetical protein